jgi:pyridoxamine 5'-phosphate oxidase
MPLYESRAPRDPLGLFNRWYLEAANAGAAQPDAVGLATATPTGEPSVRMVLFKGVESGAFRFYTN